MAEVNVIDWHINPFRAERWYEIWIPAVERSRSFGATSFSLTRSIDDPLHFRQTTVWNDREDFERYWSSDEVSDIREEAFSYFHKPLVHGWHTILAGE